MADHALHLQEMRRLDAAGARSYVLRVICLTGCCLAGYIFLGVIYPLVWVAFYYTLDLGKRAILFGFPEAQSRNFFRLQVFLSFLTSAAYVSLPVYFWYQETSHTHFVAMVMITAGVLNIVVLRATIRPVGIAAVIPMMGAFFLLAFSYFTPPNGGDVFWASFFIASLASVFLILAVTEAYRASKRLKDIQAQFIQAQKLEALGTLTGGIAHDFNNLLSVIQGNLELVKEYPQNPDRDECLTDALYATHRGATLTSQLLTLSRQAKLEPKELMPRHVLLTFESLARRVLPENIHLSVHCKDGIGGVLADESLLQTALLNLVINARDAMPNGGKLLITAHRLAAGADEPPRSLPRGDFVVLSVTDTGLGIPEDILGRVTDPFFTTKGPAKGSGLGLSMVHGFAQQSDGEMQIESRVGRGTTVRLYLPATASQMSFSAAAY